MPLAAIALGSQNSQLWLAATQRAERLRSCKWNGHLRGQKLSHGLQHDAREERIRFVTIVLLVAQKVGEQLPLMFRRGCSKAFSRVRQVRWTVGTHNLKHAWKPHH